MHTTERCIAVGLSSSDERRPEAKHGDESMRPKIRNILRDSVPTLEDDDFLSLYHLTILGNVPINQLIFRPRKPARALEHEDVPVTVPRFSRALAQETATWTLGFLHHTPQYSWSYSIAFSNFFRFSSQRKRIQAKTRSTTTTASTAPIPRSTSIFFILSFQGSMHSSLRARSEA